MFSICNRCDRYQESLQVLPNTQDAVPDNDTATAGDNSTAHATATISGAMSVQPVLPTGNAQSHVSVTKQLGSSANANLDANANAALPRANRAMSIRPVSAPSIRNKISNGS